MPTLSTRISDDEARQLDAIARARRITGRGARSLVVRALIEEEQARIREQRKPPKVAPLDELKELLTGQARKGNVPAMKELRALLDREDAERREREEREAAAAAAAGEKEPAAKVTPLDAIRNRRAKR